MRRKEDLRFSEVGPEKDPVEGGRGVGECWFGRWVCLEGISRSTSSWMFVVCALSSIGSPRRIWLTLEDGLVGDSFPVDVALSNSGARSWLAHQVCYQREVINGVPLSSRA
jgi:hypothetical protein